MDRLECVALRPRGDYVEGVAFHPCPKDNCERALRYGKKGTAGRDGYILTRFESYTHLMSVLGKAVK